MRDLVARLARERAGDERAIRSRATSGSLAVATFFVSALLSYAALQLLGQSSDSPAAAVEAAPVQTAAPTEAPPTEPFEIELFASVEPARPETAPEPEPRAPEAEVIVSDTDALLERSATIRVVTGEIEPGDTLVSALAERDVAAGVAGELSGVLRPVFDCRLIQPNDHFALILDGDGEIVSFDLQRGRDDAFQVTRTPDGNLVASRKELEFDRQVVQVGGLIARSLAEAVSSLGEGPELTGQYADIFQWDIDFANQTQPGDEFRMLVEKFYDTRGFHHYGNILAAQYLTSQRRYTAVYFEDADGQGDYFNPEGRSLRRSFLRAPVKYSRISSGYTKSRLHPILKVRRPHEGIDYVAPTGTAVWAVADGTVIFKGWSGGLGRTVKVRHANGFISFYGHLSRFGERIQKGTRVRQRQVIGYVGKSGLATGPHLDYRLQYHGEFVNPQTARFPSGSPIPVRDRDRFEEIRDLRLAELEAVESPLVLEAGM